MKLETVGNVPGTLLGMLADLMHKLQNGIITPEQLGLFLKKENPFEVITNILADWTRFWQKLGFEVGEVTNPEKRPGFDRLLVIPKGLTIEAMFQICKKMFKCWRYTDQNLDEAVPTNDRVPTDKSYAIWVRERVEADEEFKKKSANDLEAIGHIGITALERLIYEAKYFDETRKHLDINNVTLCAGSRFSDGFVPSMNWFGGHVGLYLYWYHPDIADDDLRSREVVS
ncbi:MAG: hypothetical protein ABR875_03245 [Minisyncoccia bacterium]